MKRPLQIKISNAAAAQIETVAAWWAENRRSAPGAVHEDLDRVLNPLALEPGIGTPARATTLRGVRRVTLLRVRYHLYYRVTDDSLEVLAFWHTSRGHQPDL
ncbi:MAG: type II toxin-antitoxin system RelE/ParE family toxin [Vicinamibacteria bacterium]